jgi:hypothetical protein
MVGIIGAIWFLPHECATTVQTGRSVDLRVVEGPDGQPIPGPGVFPEEVCVSYDERIPLRAVVAFAIALVLSVLGWSSTTGSAVESFSSQWPDYVGGAFSPGTDARTHRRGLLPRV